MCTVLKFSWRCRLRLFASAVGELHMKQTLNANNKNNKRYIATASDGKLQLKTADREQLKSVRWAPM